MFSELLGGIPTPLKNMSSSVGIMKFPTEWKVIKFHGSKPPARKPSMGQIFCHETWPLGKSSSQMMDFPARHIGRHV